MLIIFISGIDNKINKNNYQKPHFNDVKGLKPN